MEDRNGNNSPMLQICVNNSTVIVRFSRAENAGLKDLVRDILTEAYEERLQKGLLPCNQSM